MDENRNRLLENNRRSAAARRAFQPFQDGEAFHYDPHYNYESEPKINIGAMNTMCQYCNALQWKNITIN